MALPPTWDLFGDDHLPHRLQLLAKMIDRETARRLQREFGLSLAEWRVLAFVCTAGPSIAADIGSAYAIDRAEVSRAVSKLLDRGLIVRSTDPGHGKRLILAKSNRGSDVFRAVRDRRREYFQAILRDIPDRTLEEVNESLRQVATRVVESAGDE